MAVVNCRAKSCRLHVMVFSLKTVFFFPLCLPQWIFSYSILLKDCGDGLKLLFTSRDMSKITSLNAVCNSWFDPKVPLHKGHL